MIVSLFAQKSMAPKMKVKVYRSEFKAMAGSTRGGQGYQSMGFVGEQRTLNRTMKKKGKFPH